VTSTSITRHVASRSLRKLGRWFAVMPRDLTAKSSVGPTGAARFLLQRGIAAVVVLVLGACVVAGCGGGRKSHVSTSSTSTSSQRTVVEGTTTNAESASVSEGESIFQSSCSSCHMLAAAKATFGTYGPNLDQLKPSEEAVQAQVTSGGGIMPAFGKDGILSGSQIKVVATYVAAVAGK
jgi:cytochrome c6